MYFIINVDRISLNTLTLTAVASIMFMMIGHELRKFTLGIFASFILMVAAVPIHAMEEEKTFLVGFAQDNMENAWRTQQVMKLKQELTKYPLIKFIYTDAKGQVGKAVKDIEGLMEMGVDLLVVSPQSPTLTNPIISQVHKSGIPVVLLTRNINSQDYTTFISPDDYAIGRLAAKEIAENLGGKGEVFALQGLPGASTVVRRMQGFEDQLKEYDDITISVNRAGNYLRADAIKVVAETIEQGLHFDAIFAHNDNMAVGARIAMRAFGIDPKDIPTVGIDYIDEARNAIKSGEQTVSFTYPTCAKEASVVIWDILQGKSVEKRIVVPSQKVTAENVDEVEPLF